MLSNLFFSKPWLVALGLCLFLAACGGGSGKDRATVPSSKDTNTQINGSIGIADEQGNIRSFHGAKARIFGIEESYYDVKSGKGVNRISKGAGAVAPDNGITIFVSGEDIKEEDFYVVEVTCLDDTGAILCPSKTNFHAVLPGQALKEGGWAITILTELAFKEIEYLVRAKYSAKVVLDTLDVFAKALFEVGADFSKLGNINYKTLLSWFPYHHSYDELIESDKIKAAESNFFDKVGDIAILELLQDLKRADQRSVELEYNGTIEAFANGKAILTSHYSPPSSLFVVDTESPEAEFFKLERVWDFAVNDRGLYVVQPAAIVYYSLDDLSNPEIVMPLDNQVYFRTIRGIAVRGDYLYLAWLSADENDSIIKVYRVDSSGASLIGGAEHEIEGKVVELTLLDRTLYVETNSTFSAFYVNNENTLDFLHANNRDTKIYRMTRVGQCLARLTKDGLELFKLGDRGELEALVDFVHSDYFMSGSTTNHLFVRKDSRLDVFSTDMDCNLQLQGSEPNWGQFGSSYVSEPYFLTVEDLGNRGILKIRRPGQIEGIPSAVNGSLRLPSRQSRGAGIESKHSILYLDLIGNFCLIDVANPMQPQTNSCPGELSSNVDLKGSTGLVVPSEEPGTFDLFDFQNSGFNVTRFTEQSTSTITVEYNNRQELIMTSAILNGDRLFVSFESDAGINIFPGKVRVYDVSSPMEPKEITVFNVMSNPKIIRFVGDFLVFMGQVTIY